MKISIFCDGGCRGNQNDGENLGAWAFHASVTANGITHSIEKNAAVRNTTNNIMELQACIEALKAMKVRTVPICVYSDSAYVINGVNEWVYGWERNGWKKGKKKNEEILNLELWQELHKLRNSFDMVSFLKVKGHSDNEGNNRADELVNEAMDEYLRQELKQI